jgi:NTE family protein
MTRMLATMLTIHRRTESLMLDLLHRMAANREIEGFLLPYLGMQDNRIPAAPSDLVSRDEAFNYPTDFSPMSKRNIQMLSKRGEQITRCLLDAYGQHI